MLVSSIFFRLIDSDHEYKREKNEKQHEYMCNCQELIIDRNRHRIDR